MAARVWTEVALHPEALARLKAAVEVTEAGGRDTLPGADVAVIGSSRVDDGFLDRAGPSLRMVVRHGIGYDKVDVGAATARGVLAANTPNGPTEGTAEHAVGMMLAVAKGICKADRVLHADGDWPASKHRGIELFGRTLGLVGFGRIGQRVAEICGAGLRMNVTFFDPYAPAELALPPHVSRAATLADLLERADVVSLPRRPTAISSARRLRRMKPDAILINTSRGEVVDEAALAAVLGSGHLRGAGIDVFDPEPCRRQSALSPRQRRRHLASRPRRPASFRSSAASSTRSCRSGASGRLYRPAAWPGRAGAAAAGRVRGADS